MPAAVESVGYSEGQSESQLQSLRARSLGPVVHTKPLVERPWPRSGSAKWVLKITQRAMVKRRSYGSIWQSVLSPHPRPSVSQTTEASTPFERIKRRTYSYKEVLFFLLPSSRYTTGESRRWLRCTHWARYVSSVNRLFFVLLS